MAKDKAFGVSDYEIFSIASSAAAKLRTTISQSENDFKQVQKKLGSDTIFMGPIANSCKDEFSRLSGLNSAIREKFNGISKALNMSSEQYKKLDADGKKEYLSAGDFAISSFVSGNTQATSIYDLGNRANNGDKAAQKEWLDKMSKLVEPYCKKYGFAESVLLAQIIQESGWVKSGSWLNDNNNVLNVNGKMFGSNDYVVAKDGTRNDNAPIPKWASNPKFASGSVSGGEYFESPRVDSMRVYDSVEDCVEDYLGLMVGYRPYLSGADVDSTIDGISHYAEDAAYSRNLHSIVDSYGLTKYDS